MGQAWHKACNIPQMGRTALWKLERRVDPSVNTQHQGTVGKRPWTDGFSPNPCNGQSWSVQHVPIPHAVSKEP